MNSNLGQNKMSVIEEALKFKDEGKRLSYIIEKFPDYESEIREVFGTVAFIKENDVEISAPKNILKTLLSKMTDNSLVQPETYFKKEIERVSNNVYVPVAESDEDTGDDGSSISSENNIMFSKWKIIIPMIILAVVMGIILLRSGSRAKNEIINKNIESSQNLDRLNSVPNANDISSSTKNNN